MTDMMAEACLTTTDLSGDIGFFTGTLGFRMDMIYPADDPAVAVFSGHGLRFRLERGTGAPGRLRLLSDAPDQIGGGARVLTAPGGTTVDIDALNPPLVLPATQSAVGPSASATPQLPGRR